ELNEENSAEEQQKYIENISQSSERLSHLMNEIITLSRIEAENLKVDIKPVNLHKLLNKVIQQYRNKIKHSNKQIDILDDFAFDDRDVVVSADEKHYEEVLRQLMDNAVKYTEKGEIRIGYHFVEDDIVEVFVQDTGMGINKEFQSQVFELFSQADNSDTRKHKGAGLGLSISQKLVMLMRGALTFESEEGIGSIFKTTLKGHTAKQEQKIQNTNQHFDIRLLVITDSATTGTYLKAVLKKTASSIVIYDSLKEGLKALSYHQPDLVLISQSIIQYGDKQICISIRKALPETKIMLLHEDMKYDRQQFDGVIEPNFTQKEINNIISRALQ
ncbi:MAG: ATP-binding protein, partial [Bacteroidota bacterium]